MLNRSYHSGVQKLLMLMLCFSAVVQASAFNLSGTITGNDHAIGGAAVTLWRIQNSVATELATTNSTANGFYIFGVDPGTYKLRVVPPGGSNLQQAIAEGIVVANESVTRNFLLQPASTVQTGNLSGTVFASDGVTSVSGITVFVGSYQTVTGPLGRYELSLPTGGYGIGVRKAGSAVLNIPCPVEFTLPNRAEASITNGSHIVRNITLPYFPVLSGRVSGPGNVNVREALVTASTVPPLSPNPTPSAFSKGFTNADGRYTMRVIAGLFNMNVTPPANSGLQPAGAAGVNVSGDTTRDFVLGGGDIERPIITGGPTVTSITDRTAFIEWVTNEPASTTVKYGISLELGLTTNTPGLVTNHGQRLTGLVPNTLYNAQVVSRDAAENLTSSTVFNFRTMPEQENRPPVIISGPAVVNITSNSVVIEWGTNEPATSIVYFGTTPELGQSITNLNLLLSHRMVLQNLLPATTYYLRVGSKDAAGLGPTIAPPYSLPAIQFRTKGIEGDHTAPVITAGPLAVDVGARAATISWTTNEPASSEVTYSGAGITRNANADGFVINHAVRIVNLTPGTVYTATAASRDAYGNGPTVSHSIEFRTAPEEDTTLPRILEGPVAVYVNERAAVIRWRTNEPSDSTVVFGTTSSTLTRSVANPQLITRHDIALTDLTPNTMYYYRVKSKDGAGNGPVISELRQFKTKVEADTRPPVITSGPLILKRTDRSITIFWRTDEISNSVVEYGSGGSFDRHFADQRLVFEHVVTLADLEANSQYQFVVSSSDFTGNNVSAPVPTFEGGASAASSVGPRVVASSTITDSAADSEAPVITQGPNIVALTNDAALVRWVTNEIADSRVDYGPQAQPASFTSGEIDLTAEHLVALTNLSPATAYALQVSSQDGNGNGPVQSGTVYFTTSASADTAAPLFTPLPSATIGTAGQEILSWGTSEYGTTLVEYGTSAGSQTNIAAADGHSPGHGIILTNLSPSTTYYYTAVSVDLAGNEARSSTSSFTSAPPAAGVMDWSMY